MDQVPSTMRDTSPVIELRQYTLHPGRRDELVALFESKFIESQEAAGIRVLGQFRDLDDANRFVWLRGFSDLRSRAPALQSFYGGPVWKAHRNAANATMIDSDNVLLLRPVKGSAGLPLSAHRAPASATRPASSLVLATVYLLSAPVDEEFNRFFETRVMPLLAAAGAPVVGRFQTETAPNEFPALPVRGGEHAFAWFASFASREAYDLHLASLRAASGWRDVESELKRRFRSPPQVLRLQPTARSLFGHAPLPVPIGDVHDFDFLAGDWNVVNRRLKVRGVGSTEWDEFPATHHGELHLGGVANVDEIDFLTQGWSGMTVRAFDVARRQWSIWWINSRTGTLFPPVLGGFSGDRGEFYGEDEDGGRPVMVRLDEARRRRRPLGAGVLARRGVVGNELDHGVHAGTRREGERPQVSAFRPESAW